MLKKEIKVSNPEELEEILLKDGLDQFTINQVKSEMDRIRKKVLEKSKLEEVWVKYGDGSVEKIESGVFIIPEEGKVKTKDAYLKIVLGQRFLIWNIEKDFAKQMLELSLERLDKQEEMKLEEIIEKYLNMVIEGKLTFDEGITLACSKLKNLSKEEITCLFNK